MKSFGEIIRDLRKERGLTQHELTKLVKKEDGTVIGMAYMNDLEKDRRGPPKTEMVAEFAHALNVAEEVLQFYVGRIWANGHECSDDPPHVRIIAAYQAFYRELQDQG
jgi:HTH-type transcriptional regulator, competence development regulator